MSKLRTCDPKNVFEKWSGLLGYRSRMPGPARVWLKTYVLITFINGIVGSLEITQQILLHTLPHFGGYTSFQCQFSS